MKARGQVSLRCPIGGEAHGKLIPTQAGFYCPHQSHDGNRNTKPTKKFFTYEEVIDGTE